MYIVMKSDELLHYGVKGMRWGVRKDDGAKRSTGSKAAKAAKIISPVGYVIGKGVKKAVKVAKSPNTAKRARSAQNKYRNLTGSKASAATKKYRNKNIDGMSDADLRKAVNRMNLERQYRDLTKADFKKGQRAANLYLGYKVTGKKLIKK